MTIVNYILTTHTLLHSEIDNSLKIDSQILFIKHSHDEYTLYLDNIPRVILSKYSSALTVNSQSYGRDKCIWLKYDYETLQVNVITFGSYNFSSISSTKT
jgi:hypothetical protein